MKVLILLSLVAVALAEQYEPIALDYHETFGIKEAERIRLAEQAMDFSGGRIIGGSLAGLGSHPHFGGLLVILGSGAQSVCGSSLLSNTRAITAAHCWSNTARQVTVVLSSTTLFSGGTRVVSTNVQMHANYNPNNLNNDVAIIVLPWVNYNNNIRNINRPSGSATYAGNWAVAAGFGRTGDNVGIGNNQVLRQVSLQVITNALCQQTYGSNTVVASTICTASTANANVCSGDSGGPLSVTSGGQPLLIGVTSFVAAAGCQRGFPAGFARVTSFNAWIQARL